MNRSHRAAPIACSLFLAGGALPAVAQNIGMPAGARQWIVLQGGWANPGDCCDEAVGGVGSIPYPSPDYANDPAVHPDCVVYANGDCTPNRMRSSYYQQRSTIVWFYNAMVDTYTIVGPAGTEGTPVGARLVFRATGTLFVSACCGQYLGGSWLVLEAGTWDGNPDPTFHEGFRVASFDDPNFTRRLEIPFAFYGPNQPTLQVDTTIDQILTRTVGQPFEVAYGLGLNGHGAGDLSGSPSPQNYIVAEIDWELPAGYSISSSSGWTDPNDPPPCAADINHSGTPTVQDIFDFLEYFFANDPRGDFNGVGGLTPQDIFDFLAAFFAGC